MAISNNTTKLQALLDKANSLPDAGSGDSVGSIEWIDVMGLPRPYAAEPVEPVTYYLPVVSNSYVILEYTTGAKLITVLGDSQSVLNVTGYNLNTHKNAAGMEIGRLDDDGDVYLAISISNSLITDCRAAIIPA